MGIPWEFSKNVVFLRIAIFMLPVASRGFNASSQTNILKKKMISFKRSLLWTLCFFALILVQCECKRRVEIKLTCDNAFDAYFSNLTSLSGNDWGFVYTMTVDVDPGDYVFAVKAIDGGGIAAFSAIISVDGHYFVGTDRSGLWKASSAYLNGWNFDYNYDDSSWVPINYLCPYEFQNVNAPEFSYPSLATGDPVTNSWFWYPTCQQANNMFYLRIKLTIPCLDCPICASGQTLDPNTQTCVSCPANEYKVLPGLGPCLDCPLGAFCDGVSFQCDSSKGYMYDQYGYTCVPCPQNSVCKDGTFICDPSAGSYYTPDKKGCLLCPPNSKCYADRFECDNEAGYMLNGDQNGCMPCPGNSTCRSTSFSCNPGFTLGIDENSCVPCKSGEYKTSSGNELCTRCSPGTVQPLAGQVSCLPCAANTYMPNAGRPNCFACAAGSYQKNTGSATGCIKCAKETDDPRCVLPAPPPPPPPPSSNSPSSDSNGMSASTSAIIGVSIVLPIAFIVFGMMYLKYVRKVPPAQLDSVASPKPPSIDIENGSSNHTAMTMSTVNMEQSTLSIPGFLEVSIANSVSLGKKIATGGAGSIYLCKIIKPELKASAGCKEAIVKVAKTTNVPLVIRDSFFQEISLNYYLCTHFPRYFAKLLAYDPNSLSIIMRYYPSGSLLRYYRSLKTMKKSVMLSLLSDVCKGIEIMHKEGFTHNDLKSDNVLVEIDMNTKKPRAVLSDFGISRVLDSQSVMKVHSFKTVQVRGLSMPYASPEAINLFRHNTNGKAIDPMQYKSSDVYSYACIILEVMIRKRPWSTEKKEKNTGKGKEKPNEKK